MIHILAGLGLVVGGIATIKAASKVPKGPFSQETRVPPYYNPYVQRSLRNSRAFAHFNRRQHTVTDGEPEVVDDTGMTLSHKEAWIRSIERVRARTRSLG